MRIVTAKHRCRLENCPVGLFLSASGNLCLMTEYHTNGNRDAYIASTGEYFWGGTTDFNERRMLLVTPCTVIEGLR